MATYDPDIQGETVDIVIVGAGISGINAAYRVKTELPDHKFIILESRNDIGGTWDLFRYPGIRSDSDLHTFGFSWSPWMENRAIADGESIARYMKENAARQGIERHIRFQNRLASANWSSKSQTWSLIVEVEGKARVIVQTRFLVLGTGYYDHHRALKAQIPGLQENFRGKVIHPQFWPDDFDWTGKKLVVIGSGATAITLIPNLVDKAEHVTMLQRSPTYIMTLDNATGGSWLHKFLSKSMSFRLTRLSFLLTQIFMYAFCRLLPNAARSMLQGKVARQLPPHVPVDPHFTPRYKPWDQRLCFTPDGDFFACLRSGKADVVTDTVNMIQEKSILLSSGRALDADIIVTATGLKIGIASGFELSVDGVKVDVSHRYAWRSAMLQDVPNLFMIVGYTNAPWTLGADANQWILCRLARNMQRRRLAAVTPRLGKDVKLRDVPLWDLKSTYVKEGLQNMPKCGDLGPWRARTNYFYDFYKAKYANIMDGLEFGGSL